MPGRSQSIIRRDINRLVETLEYYQEEYPVFKALLPYVRKRAVEVNGDWNAYQAATIAGDKERFERDTSVGSVLSWHQCWRPGGSLCRARGVRKHPHPAFERLHSGPDYPGGGGHGYLYRRQ